MADYNDITKTGALTWRQLQENNQLDYDELNHNLPYINRNIDYLDDYDTSPRVPVGNYEDLTYEASLLGLGKSKYDTNILTRQDLYNINEIRADNLSGWESIANGALKGAVIAGTTFADSFLGTLAGIGNVINEAALGNINSLNDLGKAFVQNPFSLLMQDINNKSEEWLPNYYSEEEQNSPWWELIFNANFIGDHFLKNTGFFVGAALSGKATAGMLSKVGRLKKARDAFRGIAVEAGMGDATSAEVLKAYMTGDKVLDGRVVTELLAKSAKKVKLAELGVKMASAAAGSYGESRMEAITGSTDYFDKNKARLDLSRDAALASIMDNIKGQYTGLFTTKIVYDEQGNTLFRQVPKDADAEMLIRNIYNNEVKRITDKYNSALLELSKERVDYANKSFLINHLLTSVENFWIFGDAMVGGYSSARKALSVAKKDGKYVATNAARNKAIFKGAISPVFEGTQEMFQQATVLGLDIWEGNKLNTFYGSGISNEGLRATNNFFSTMMLGLGDTYSDPDQWENFALGFLTALLPIPASGRKADGTKGKLSIGGEFWESIREARLAKASSVGAAQAMNDFLDDPEKVNKLLGFMRYNYYGDLKDRAAQDGNAREYKNNELDLIISQALVFSQAGLLDDFRALVEAAYALNELDLDTLKALGKIKNSETSIFDGKTDEDILLYANLTGQLIQKIIDRVDELSQSLDVLYGPDLSQAFKQEYIRDIINIDDREQRIKEVAGEIQSYINANIDTLRRLLPVKTDVVSGEPIDIPALLQTNLLNIQELKTFLSGRSLDEYDKLLQLARTGREEALKEILDRLLGKKLLLEIKESDNLASLLMSKESEINSLRGVLGHTTKRLRLLKGKRGKRGEILDILNERVNLYASIEEVSELLGIIKALVELEMLKTAAADIGKDIVTKMDDLQMLLIDRESLIAKISRLSSDPQSFDDALSTQLTKALIDYRDRRVEESYLAFKNNPNRSVVDLFGLLDATIDDYIGYANRHGDEELADALSAIQAVHNKIMNIAGKVSTDLGAQALTDIYVDVLNKMANSLTGQRALLRAKDAARELIMGIDASMSNLPEDVAKDFQYIKDLLNSLIVGADLTKKTVDANRESEKSKSKSESKAKANNSNVFTEEMQNELTDIINRFNNGDVDAEATAEALKNFYVEKKHDGLTYWEWFLSVNIGDGEDERLVKDISDNDAEVLEELKNLLTDGLSALFYAAQLAIALFEGTETSDEEMVEEEEEESNDDEEEGISSNDLPDTEIEDMEDVNDDEPSGDDNFSTSNVRVGVQIPPQDLPQKELKTDDAKDLAISDIKSGKLKDGNAEERTLDTGVDAWHVGRKAYNYLIKPLKNIRKRLAKRADNNWFTSMLRDRFKAFEFIENGELARLKKLHPELPIHIITYRGNEGKYDKTTKTWSRDANWWKTNYPESFKKIREKVNTDEKAAELLAKIEKSSTMVAAIEIPNDFRPKYGNVVSVYDQLNNAIKMLVLGSISPETNRTIHPEFSKLSLLVKKITLKHYVDNRGKRRLSPLVDSGITTDIEWIYSGRIAKSTEASPDILNRSINSILTKEQRKALDSETEEDPFRIAVVTVDGQIVKGKMNVLPQDVVPLNLHYYNVMRSKFGLNKSTRVGTIWIQTREADGKVYYKGVKVRQFNKDWSGTDSVVDKKIKSACKDLAASILKKDTNDLIKAFVALKTQLYLFESPIKISKDFNTLSFRGKQLKHEDFKDKSAESFGNDIYNLLRDSGNLRFQVVADTKISLKEIVYSDILYTDLAQLKNVNASFAISRIKIDDTSGNEGVPTPVKSVIIDRMKASKAIYEGYFISDNPNVPSGVARVDNANGLVFKYDNKQYRIFVDRIELIDGNKIVAIDNNTNYARLLRLAASLIWADDNTKTTHYEKVKTKEGKDTHVYYATMEDSNGLVCFITDKTFTKVKSVYFDTRVVDNEEYLKNLQHYTKLLLNIKSTSISRLSYGLSKKAVEHVKLDGPVASAVDTINKWISFASKKISVDKRTHTYKLDGKKADYSVTLYYQKKTGGKEFPEDKRYFGDIGNIVDEHSRDFFGDKKLKDRWELDGHLSRLLTYLKLVHGDDCVILTNEIPLAVNVPLAAAKISVAGTPDMIVIDKNGDYYLYDFKTKNKSIEDFKGSDDELAYTFLLNMYKRMLETTLGKSVKGMNLIYFEQSVPTGLTSVTDIQKDSSWVKPHLRDNVEDSIVPIKESDGAPSTIEPYFLQSNDDALSKLTYPKPRRKISTSLPSLLGLPEGLPAASPDAVEETPTPPSDNLELPSKDGYFPSFLVLVPIVNKLYKEARKEGKNFITIFKAKYQGWTGIDSVNTTTDVANFLITNGASFASKKVWSIFKDYINQALSNDDAIDKFITGMICSH